MDFTGNDDTDLETIANKIRTLQGMSAEDRKPYGRLLKRCADRLAEIGNKIADLVKTSWTAVDQYDRSVGNGTAESPEAALCAALEKLQDTCGTKIGTHGVYLRPGFNGAETQRFDVITDYKDGEYATYYADPDLRRRLKAWRREESARQWQAAQTPADLAENLR
jgi:hypothetical protein